MIDYTVQYCSYNMKNTKLCYICEVHRHRTSECQLNARNRKNVHTIYHIEATDRNNDYKIINDYYGPGGTD
jgi:hypothetical protein